jgi:predicted transcriptional regulator
MTDVAHSTAPIIQYLEEEQMSQKDFAAFIGVSQSAVSQWMSGTKGIGLKTARRMQKKTKGRITVVSIYPSFFGKAA